MRVGIQVLNYNGMKWLPGVFASLEAHGSADQILYLVDNGSSDGSVAWIRREHPSVRVVEIGANVGYGAAYTRSVPQAFADGCDWVCLQNSDTLVTPDWLDALSAAADSDPRIGVMGPVFWQWDRDEPNYLMRGRCPDVIPFMNDAGHPPVDRDWIEGSSFFVRRECWESVGGFEPLYFMYWEDADYCRRARVLGWRVVIVPGSVCRHFAGGSATVEGRSFPLLRNHLLFAMSDPTRGFFSACCTSARLWLTYVKQTAWDHPNRPEFLRVLRAGASALAHVGRCRDSRSSVLRKLASA